MRQAEERAIVTLARGSPGHADKLLVYFGETMIHDSGRTRSSGSMFTRASGQQVKHPVVIRCRRFCSHSTKNRYVT